MSIAPFLPGLPVPAATDGGGTTSDASGGDDGSGGYGGSAFGDALAAALAGSLVVPPAGDSPVPTLAAPLPPVDLPVPSVELPVPSVELPVPSVELPVPSVELPVPLAESGVAGQIRLPVASAGSTDEGAPAFRRTTNAAVAAAGAAPTGLATMDAEAFPVNGSADSTVRIGNSTDRTDNSAVETADSASGAPNSAVATPSSAGAVTKAVVQQVFPEVTRVVSTVIAPAPAPAPGATGPANGTHRITLTLQPEQLGEVRVTLVVRDGAVHVRLAGAEGAEGAAVHRALADEAPELQRILERTGADARVTVRDPFAPLLPSTTPAPQAGPEADARSGAQSRQDRQDGRDGHSAREQPREQPRRPEPQRASYPIETTPVAGRLDRVV